MTSKTYAPGQSKMPGWFSWRHQTNEAHVAANLGRSRSETKARKRAEAEARNTNSFAGLKACGHVHGETRGCAA
jgi:hypothetical protein